MGRIDGRVQALEAKMDAMGSQLGEMHRLLKELTSAAQGRTS